MKAILHDEHEDVNIMRKYFIDITSLISIGYRLVMPIFKNVVKLFYKVVIEYFIWEE
jgi:hypothetical protein